MSAGIFPYLINHCLSPKPAKQKHPLMTKKKKLGKQQFFIRTVFVGGFSTMDDNFYL